MPRVAQGGTVALHGNVSRANGFPADPDPGATLSLTILDDAGVAVAGFPVTTPAITRDDLGEYHYDWTIPIALVVGDYTATWATLVDLGAAGGSETVEVVAPGSVDVPYLTVTDLRLHVTSALTDPALQLLLDAAYDDINDYAGPSGPCDELIVPGHGDLLMLSRPAGSVGAVVEQFYGTETTLAANDYEIRSSGQTLRRLSTGTNPSHYWRGRIDVTYTPAGDADTRKRVQLELVKLDLSFTPGVASEAIGTWSESYVSGKPYAEQRAEILASLGSGVLIV